MVAQPLSVACLGLGRIGSGIAQSVQRAGHRLMVYNRAPDKTRTFAASGTVIARSPREAAAQADVVITCLMGDESVLENMLGENGILAGLRHGAIHIGTSTVTRKRPPNLPGCTPSTAVTTWQRPSRATRTTPPRENS